MEEKVRKNSIKHYFVVPFTGLGAFNGFRGNQWLINRIKIFERFVLPSLQLQRDITLWFCWRKEEKINPLVIEFQKTLEMVREIKCVHTFGGIPFWDDKYP